MCQTALQKQCCELLPVIQAAAEGKTIQERRGPAFIDLLKCYPASFESHAEYRVKPEPQYRPFTPQEVLNHIDRIIVGPDGEVRLAAVGRISGEMRAWFSSSTYSQIPATHGPFEWLLEKFRFKDGSRCGVLIEP